MKRLIIAILIVMLLGTACQVPVETQQTPKPGISATPQAVEGDSVNAGNPTPQPTVKVAHLLPEELYGVGFINPEADKYILSHHEVNKSQSLDVPVYKYDDMFLVNANTDNDSLKYGFLKFGLDYTNGAIERGNFATRLDYLLTRMPNGAIRCMGATGVGYVMYDTDQDQRIYVYFRTEEGKPASGSPVIGAIAIMQEQLKYNNFSGVKKGDEIRSLASIDPAMNAYADYFYGPMVEIFNSGSGIESNVIARRENGYPLQTISVLSDGALKITYDYINGKFVVDTIEFSENFTLECYGGEICYRIAPVDYVE
jgi:hypothetical protein